MMGTGSAGTGDRSALRFSCRTLWFLRSKNERRCCE
jgi:hypothetical protein